MARYSARREGPIQRLTAREVLAATAGDLADGGGVWLRIGKASASWVLRYTSPGGRRREMGLGPACRETLAEAGEAMTKARDEAAKARALLGQGVDPLAAKEAEDAAAKLAERERAAEKERLRWTLKACARDYHARVIEPNRSTRHALQWIASLENHVPAPLWGAPVSSIEPPELLRALLAVTPHERARRHKGDKLPETVQRIRQRLEAVFDDAIFHKRASVNPAAAIKRKLREASPQRKRGAFKALPYGEAPALLQTIRTAPGVAARCLEFAVLTAARTSEALEAEWTEFDLAAGTWTVPGARMKGGEPHTVFLSPRVLEVLQSVQGLHTRWVFPSPQPRKEEGAPLSNMAMLTVLGRLGYRDRTTVHGLARATFSTWANETGAGRPDVIEACLAHEEGNRVRAAYNRAKFNDERRALLAAWAEFLARPAAPVLALESKRA
jgi:integrase